jgi:hypothetical protein
MGDGGLWTHDADWTVALREPILTYLGPGRRAGTRGAYTQPGCSYREDLAASAFSEAAGHRFPVSRAWMPDAVVGYLRSTSFARPQLFAGRHDASRSKLAGSSTRTPTAGCYERGNLHAPRQQSAAAEIRHWVRKSAIMAMSSCSRLWQCSMYRPG